MKQLIEILHCNLQVMIHKGLVEAQADILKAITGFINIFHIKVMTLSAPQVHALLNQMHARHTGSHFFLAVIRQGTTPKRPESFLERDPAHLLLSFYDWLPDSQMSLDRGSAWPTELEREVNQTEDP